MKSKRWNDIFNAIGCCCCTIRWIFAANVVPKYAIFSGRRNFLFFIYIYMFDAENASQDCLFAKCEWICRRENVRIMCTSTLNQRMERRWPGNEHWTVYMCVWVRFFSFALNGLHYFMQSNFLFSCDSPSIYFNGLATRKKKKFSKFRKMYGWI